MRRSVISIFQVVFFFSLLTPIYAQPTPPVGKAWEEVPELTDEFDTWDSDKWWKPLWNYGVPVQMLDANSGVTDGKLWIKATLDDGATRWFETSRVMSYEQISYPMYTECSMKTAHISAYNTFWLNNGDSNDRDEFDICENNSKPSITSQTQRPYTMYSQYFIVKNGVTERAHGNFDNRNLSDDNPLQGVKWNETYHTLGAWWKDAHNIQFYLNGEEAGSVTTTDSFTLELNIIWDLWTIDADWAGGIAIQSDLLDDDINTMYVDWIHTYKLVDAPYNNLTQNSAKANHFTIYPNPVVDNLNIAVDGTMNNNAMVSIYNSMGSLVREERIMERETQISFNEIPAGLYVIKLRNGNSITTKMFIKE